MCTITHTWLSRWSWWSPVSLSFAAFESSGSHVTYGYDRTVVKNYLRSLCQTELQEQRGYGSWKTWVYFIPVFHASDNFLNRLKKETVSTGAVPILATRGWLLK